MTKYISKLVYNCIDTLIYKIIIVLVDNGVACLVNIKTIRTYVLKG